MHAVCANVKVLDFTVVGALTVIMMLLVLTPVTIGKFARNT